MLIDAELMFSDKQDLAASGYSTNTVEIPPGLTAGIDMAAQVIVRSRSGIEPTLTVEIETSNNPESGFAKLAGVTIPEGETQYSISLNVSGLKKYLRLRYELGGIDPVFSVTAILVEGGGFNSHQRIERVSAGRR
jgi:hypothetical protein